MEDPSISFCIISIGEKPNETDLCIRSIKRNFTSNNCYEIIIVGNNIDQFKGENVKLVKDDVWTEFLGAKRNQATLFAKNEIIVHCDDDIIFPDGWFDRFCEYNSQNKDWQVLGNKVLLPDGGRYWDRATFKPNHRMISYDEEVDGILYQSGCFGVFKRSLLENVSWDSNIPFYGERVGFKYNEDVEFSVRLNEKSVDLFFDKDNLVWHNDNGYTSNGVHVTRLKKQSDSFCSDFLSDMSKLDPIGNLVFGLGTGRCGTHSLAELLNKQKGFNITHEINDIPFLPWEKDLSSMSMYLDNIKVRKEKFSGDVSLYTLPYVEDILKMYPKAKFVSLKRDKKETINSFLKKTEGRNHWQVHNGLTYKPCIWDQCFPKYSCETKKQAIGMYWDEYYLTLEKLMEKYPNNINIFNINEMNSHDGISDILSFVGIKKEDQVVKSVRVKARSV